MSGHNKWSKIKRKKGATDAKRSKEFSRVVKEIYVAVKEGNSGDPEFNPRLRVALANAKGVNMPKDNVNRAIKKALDSSTGDMYQVNYEGYTPGGIAVFVECTTDNLKRTVASVRSIFSKNGGNLATNGSVDFLFERKGIFIIESVEGMDMDELEMELIDGGAEDIEVDEETNEIEITTPFDEFGNMTATLERLGIEPKSANAERLPLNTTELPLADAKTAMRLIDLLEEDEDVNMVFHNLEITEELAAELE